MFRTHTIKRERETQRERQTGRVSVSETFRLQYREVKVKQSEGTFL